MSARTERSRTNLTFVLFVPIQRGCQARHQVISCGRPGTIGAGSDRYAACPGDSSAILFRARSVISVCAERARVCQQVRASGNEQLEPDGSQQAAARAATSLNNFLCSGATSISRLWSFLPYQSCAQVRAVCCTECAAGNQWKNQRTAVA